MLLYSIYLTDADAAFLGVLWSVTRKLCGAVSERRGLQPDYGVVGFPFRVSRPVSLQTRIPKGAKALIKMQRDWKLFFSIPRTSTQHFVPSILKNAWKLSINTMPWPAKIVRSFDLANSGGEKDESEFYGSFNMLLNYLFPYEEDYEIVLQFKRLE